MTAWLSCDVFVSFLTYKQHSSCLARKKVRETAKELKSISYNKTHTHETARWAHDNALCFTVS